MLNRTAPSSVSRTHKLLEILAEHYLSFKPQHSQCPLEDQLRALRLTVKAEFLKVLFWIFFGFTHFQAHVKHLHSVGAPSETDQCAAVASFILSEFFEPKMPKLIAHCTEHWPVDCSFRLVLETFLSYVQPWRYRAGPDEVRF